MNIGEAARATGVTAKMIRYYDAIGLVVPSGRTAAGYRVYDVRDIANLRFVRRARDLGFPVARIADLLALWADRGRHSADVRRLAQQQMEGLRRQINEMQAMVDALDELVACCAGDDRPDCPILRGIGGPAGAGGAGAGTPAPASARTVPAGVPRGRRGRPQRPTAT